MLVKTSESRWLVPFQRRQRQCFLVAAGVSSIGSFAGIIAKGWLIQDMTQQPLLLAVNFACLSLPAVFLSPHAGTLTDRIGSESVLKRSQYFLLIGAIFSAIGYVLCNGWVAGQVTALIGGTLIVGIASAYELTSRLKYVGLIVPEATLAGYLAQFSVIFNVAKLIGPPVGGFALTFLHPSWVLSLDALSYLVPIAVVNLVMQPRSLTAAEQPQHRLTMTQAWQGITPQLRSITLFAGVASVIGFFHPAIVPVLAKAYIGPDPLSLGWLTASIAIGSITAGLLQQRFSESVIGRPRQMLILATGVTAIAQVGFALQPNAGIALFLAALIGFGTAGLLAGANIIGQALAPWEYRGRVAGLTQIATLGGGGVSSLLAGGLIAQLGLPLAMGLLGVAGLLAALVYGRQSLQTATR
ncbi:MFS transporter [Synechococcus elongatus]|uniref:Multidrug efflux MFS transporter n=1 Tax=Synechococcus elongatus (strain ATCC 33912 / PCC 7942 / FACHB-805) TaxID=1140 RepID=Q31Q45_SYNE7|nr:MFS transporter [Synechococcus elongatus]ABB56824.1 putative multidrug efflux MFS transporter [Synechococcus elongatus PCC 7942 = FACHB-805]AJD58647.1 MFS transporter [Synechococcus elongatus UTEX 2973]MBD2588694.1 MFS transporter [Synechococcus elongatus FACHB-242]MBD2689718.1 MFS transporter [Synechococcus elongatus FACHB-1061]MBD2708324.1 MFS transporter [Synechococcus elongatus PCC 7942 = FACHB-805]